MASRKAKAREKKPPPPPPLLAPPSMPRRSALPEIEHDTERDELRPSSLMTREMPTVTVDSLLAGSRTGSNPRIAAAAPAAPPPPTVRALDELAITTEAPAGPRLAILDAAEALIVEVGFVDATEAAIAKRADLSVDVLHAHFVDKSAILAALTERFCDQAISVTNEATHIGIWDSAAPRDVIEVSVRSILDVVLGRSALVRAVLASGDQAMLDGFRRVGANITTRVTRAIDAMDLTERPDVVKPDPRDVAFAFLIAVSLAHHTIMVGTEWSGAPLDRDELYERATRAAIGFLEKRGEPS